MEQTKLWLTRWLCLIAALSPIKAEGQLAQDNNKTSAPLYQMADYKIKEDRILKNGKPIVLRGVNAMHIFNTEDPSLSSWHGINIIREFVCDIKDEPIESGKTFHDPERNWTLRSLQDIVACNRARGQVTILCPFSWDNDKSHEFTGCGDPLSADWYQSYKEKMREWATFFNGQSDVWLELMNEPFRKLTPTQDQFWLRSTNDMVRNLRSAGWDGIILVPAADWSGDETVVERMGPQLIKGQSNILFDIHVYDDWLKHPETIVARYQNIQNSKLPFIYGELGPGAHDTPILDPQPFIHLAQQKELSVLAWGWGTWGKRKAINLQTNEGGPNDNGNYNWGSSFKNFLATSHGAEMQPVLIEAENGENLKSCHIANLPTDYTGQGTLRFESKPPFAQWSVTVPTAGIYLASIKYCNPTNAAIKFDFGKSDKDPRVLKLVSSNLGPGDPIPPWYDEVKDKIWRFANSRLELQAGRNIVSLSASTSAEGLVLDNLSFIPATQLEPVKPIFDAKAFGARGDGTTYDTAALQNCINHCAGSGGTVLLKNGNFLSGMLRLKSNMILWIDDTACLSGSTASSFYDAGPGKSLLSADGASDIVITGGGVIDGQGGAHTWDEKKEDERPALIQMNKSKGINISNVDLKNAACWTVIFKSCDHIKINAVNLRSLTHPNRDGIDPCDSHDVSITNTSILSDDDAICLKSWTSNGIQHLRARNLSLISGANGIKFGTDSYGCFDDCHFEDTTIGRTGGTGISIGMADGAEVSNAVFQNIRMGSVFVPISILQGAGLRTNWQNFDRPLKQLRNAGRVHDITLRNIHAFARRSFPSYIGGVSKSGEVFRVENVLLKNVQVENGENCPYANVPPPSQEYSGEYPDYSWMGFKTLPSFGLFVRHGQNIKIEDCKFFSQKQDLRPALVQIDVIP